MFQDLRTAVLSFDTDDATAAVVTQASVSSSHFHVARSEGDNELLG